MLTQKHPYYISSLGIAVKERAPGANFEKD